MSRKLTRENEKCLEELAKLRKKPANRYCADCGKKGPTWCSTNLGVFVCIGCSGHHRSVGVHISKVKSSTLDAWTYPLLEHFKAQGGNEVVNSIYEAKLRSGKPTESSDKYEIERFIRDKYDRKLWYSASKAKKARKKYSKSEASSEDEEEEASEDSSEDSEESESSSEIRRRRRRKKRKAQASKKSKKSKKKRTKKEAKTQRRMEEITEVTSPSTTDFIDFDAEPPAGDDDDWADFDGGFEGSAQATDAALSPVAYGNPTQTVISPSGSGGSASVGDLLSFDSPAVTQDATTDDWGGFVGGTTTTTTITTTTTTTMKPTTDAKASILEKFKIGQQSQRQSQGSVFSQLPPGMMGGPPMSAAPGAYPPPHSGGYYGAPPPSGPAMGAYGAPPPRMAMAGYPGYQSGPPMAVHGYMGAAQAGPPPASMATAYGSSVPSYGMSSPPADPSGMYPSMTGAYAAPPTSYGAPSYGSGMIATTGAFAGLSLSGADISTAMTTAPAPKKDSKDELFSDLY